MNLQDIHPRKALEHGFLLGIEIIGEAPTTSRPYIDWQGSGQLITN